MSLGALRLVAAPPNERTTPHHLVGHEDSELLDRVQDLINDWDPRKLVNPLVVVSQADDGYGGLILRKHLRRSDLAEFVADIDAMEALGKAFFWDMQAGSDFRIARGQAIGTACASCHYRAGSDARNRHTETIPYVAWDRYPIDPNHPLDGTGPLPFSAEASATAVFPASRMSSKGELTTIIGSQGVSPRVFCGLNHPCGVCGDWLSESSKVRSLEGYDHRPQWSMFLGGEPLSDPSNRFGRHEWPAFRQITTRNSPTVINSAHSNRLFHDGRAESTFNGFSIFGDADARLVIHRRRVLQTLDLAGKVVDQKVDLYPVKIAILDAALASQAVGPIVNDVEMSYLGREFPDVARKLLDARVLGFQGVADDDSLLGQGEVGAHGSLRYRSLIQQAFRREWWDESDAVNCGCVPLRLLRSTPGDGRPQGSLMEANFSLYWGLSIMFYEATLLSDRTPFDDMMRGKSERVEERWRTVRGGTRFEPPLDPVHRDQVVVAGGARPHHESGAAVFQHGFRVFLNRGCIDCHSGPFFSETYERLPDGEKKPIQYRVDKALLPNSRGDFAGLAWQHRERELLDELVKLFAPLVPFPGTSRPSLEHIAREIEALRHKAKGDLVVLVELVDSYLRSAFATRDPELHSVAENAARLILVFEHKLPEFAAMRGFFCERERVDMAETIADPLLVERMDFRPEQVAQRPYLPGSDYFHNIACLDGDARQTPEPYAFYDQSYYVLGVAPPRFDRGNGDRVEHGSSIGRRVAAYLKGEKLVDQSIIRTFARDVDRGGVQQAVRGVSDPNTREAIVRRLESYRTNAAQSASAPGRAYQLHDSLDDDDEPAVVPVRRGDAPSRAPGSGPREDIDTPDVKRWAGDWTWDRIDVPGRPQIPGPGSDDIFQRPGASHRNRFHFFSRARRMVMNEEHYGHRKPFVHDNELAFWGAFKTPTLRNVELTAPYMHNGALFTLSDVVDFYSRIERQYPADLYLNPDKHPDMRGFDLSIDDKRALLFFLLCLTDERVRYESAPFDHPSLALVNGYCVSPAGQYEEVVFTIPATGLSGRSRPPLAFPSDD